MVIADCPTPGHIPQLQQSLPASLFSSAADPEPSASAASGPVNCIVHLSPAHVRPLRDSNSNVAKSRGSILECSAPVILVPPMQFMVLWLMLASLPMQASSCNVLACVMIALASALLMQHSGLTWSLQETHDTGLESARTSRDTWPTACGAPQPNLFAWGSSSGCIWSFGNACLISQEWCMDPVCHVCFSEQRTSQL